MTIVNWLNYAAKTSQNEYVEQNIMSDPSLQWRRNGRHGVSWESIGNRWIPLKKASDRELSGFFLSAPEQTVEQIIETPEI